MIDFFSFVRCLKILPEDVSLENTYCLLGRHCVNLSLSVKKDACLTLNCWSGLVLDERWLRYVRTFSRSGPGRRHAPAHWDCSGHRPEWHTSGQQPTECWWRWWWRKTDKHRWPRKPQHIPSGHHNRSEKRDSQIGWMSPAPLWALLHKGLKAKAKLIYSVGQRHLLSLLIIDTES